jgi:hypothetical protein
LHYAFVAIHVDAEHSSDAHTPGRKHSALTMPIAINPLATIDTAKTAHGGKTGIAACAARQSNNMRKSKQR